MAYYDLGNGSFLEYVCGSPSTRKELGVENAYSR